MKPQQLIQQYPWANDKDILQFSDVLSDELWKAINEGGVPELVKNPSLKDIVLESLQVIALKNRQKAEQPNTLVRKVFSNLIQMNQVRQWFGEELYTTITDTLEPHVWDCLIKLLTAEKRASLSGETTLIQSPSGQSCYDQLSQNDIRRLLSTDPSMIKQFANDTIKSALPKDRKFPQWVEEEQDDVFKFFAMNFSNEQLKDLHAIISLTQITELLEKIEFLILLLSYVELFDITLSSYSQPDFRELLVKAKQGYLDGLPEYKYPVKITSHPVDLLNKYLKQRPAFLIYANPSDPRVFERLKQETLCKAIIAGNKNDVQVLINRVEDINAQAYNGDPALHSAAKANSSNCFLVIAAHYDCNPFTTNSKGKTALDLLSPQQYSELIGHDDIAQDDASHDAAVASVLTNSFFSKDASSDMQDEQRVRFRK